MKNIKINNVTLPVKDYHCSPIFCDNYPADTEPKLWLYVSVTNNCNAKCPFCINQKSDNVSQINTQKFEKAVAIAAPYIKGISFTGGEPMLYPELFEELIDISVKYIPENIEFDMVTNGYNLPRLAKIKNLKRFTTIHISRHSANDECNRKLMNFPGAPSLEDIKNFMSSIEDPDAVVFNCVTQKSGVKNCKDVSNYLDMAISCNIRNTSFITMIKANDYCESEYISPSVFSQIFDLSINESDICTSKFKICNEFHDYDFCHCHSGYYQNEKGVTRFYFRCPNPDTDADYCRQLVYSEENHLQDGFGKNRKIII